MIMSNNQDILFVEKIASGDTQAENELFYRYAEEIKLMVRTRLKVKVSLDNQEDIVSEILHASLVSLRNKQYDPSSEKGLGAYIAGIAFKIIGQYFRSKDKEKKIQHSLQQESHENHKNVLNHLIEKERDQKLRSYLSRLKPKYKEILLLRIYENRSIQEIADFLKLDRRRVSERIHYAFKLLIKECKKENYFSI